MSADNWGTCPRCYAKANAQLTTVVDKAAKAYGKVSADEYAQLLKAAVEAKTTRVGTTLREDYEIFMTKDGTFSVGYTGQCDECGFLYNFKHKEAVSK